MQEQTVTTESTEALIDGATERSRAEALDDTTTLDPAQGDATNVGPAQGDVTNVGPARGDVTVGGTAPGAPASLNSHVAEPPVVPAAKRPPTKAELHAIRQVRPITAEDLGPGPFATGFTLEQELEFQNYIPEPLNIAPERWTELGEEARKYVDELFAEVGEPTPEEWERARAFWGDFLNPDAIEGTS